MKPVDYRNETWDQVRERMHGFRLRVYQDLERFGPCTTRELAARMGVDLLTVRPRITELCDLGHAELASEDKGREGLYQVVPYAAALARFEQLQLAVQSDQLPLGL